MNTNDGYRLLAGKCRTICEAISKVHPEFIMVRGHYLCPIHGKRSHWWLTTKEGIVYDPTREQFPSGGIGDYVPFDGYIECAECGTKVREEDADIDGNYGFCSYKCHGKFVGVD